MRLARRQRGETRPRKTAGADLVDCVGGKCTMRGEIEAEEVARQHEAQDLPSAVVEHTIEPRGTACERVSGLRFLAFHEERFLGSEVDWLRDGFEICEFVPVKRAADTPQTHAAM